MGASQFALMKPGAIFVNGSRGAIVQEPALVEALDSGHLRAAGLDVFADRGPCRWTRRCAPTRRSRRSRT